jgi:putative nucleotidyltransferase with HDIG domain
MTRLDRLKLEVESLYRQKLPTRALWADWLYDNHVLVVAEYAKKLAKKYKADIELSEVAALLHDIADYKMSRDNPKHEAESLEIARKVMSNNGYTPNEIELVVDDAVRFHSCHGNERPKSTEGLILATADSLAHLKTDFYIHATMAEGQKTTLEEIKDWVLTKIERDLNNKISFDEEREDARTDYELIKNLFSR